MTTSEPVTARVIAVHKETSIVRGPDGIDRAAIVSGRFAADPEGEERSSAVGEWVALSNGL